MEWDAKVPGETFYHPYLSLDKIENRVIEHDIEIVEEVIRKKQSTSSADVVTERLKEHYLDSSRLIKRALGDKFDDNFQLFNWGLALTADMGLTTDKLELLMAVYSKRMPKRATVLDFEEIVYKHTSFRDLVKKKKSNKWLELLSSFKMHSVIKPGYPNSIGKKQFELILHVNEVIVDIDLVRCDLKFC